MIKRFVIWPLAALGSALLAYLCWALLAYTELPVASLIERYGTPDLRQVAIHDVPIHYRQSGTGPAVVLIHSHYFDMGMWDPWAQALEPDYTVIRYDLSSHGLSGPHPGNDYSMAEDVRLLAALLDALDIGSAHMVGSSLGGNIAFHFAALHPARTLSVTLINSGGIQRQPKAGREGEIPAWADKVLRILPRYVFRRFIDWMIVNEELDTQKIAERFHAMLRREGNRSAEMQRMRQFEYRDSAPVLARITAPVLIQWGADNPQLPVSQVHDFRQGLGAAAVLHSKVYRNAGHVLPLEQPHSTVEDFRMFLAGLQ